MCAETERGNVLGVGIDMVSVPEIRRLIGLADGTFLTRVFSEEERGTAKGEPDPAAFLAGRFAVKEAVFKAAAHLLPEKSFDLREVETLREADGSPRVRVPEALGKKLRDAGVRAFLVSISGEGELVIAIAEAVR